MKRPVPVESASALIDEKIKELGDWRGKTLAKVREIIHEPAPSASGSLFWFDSSSERWWQPACGFNRDDWNNVECMTTANSMHDYRKFKVSVNGRIGRTARLSERLRRYVTSNPASPATRRATPTTSPTWPRSCRPCAMRARTNLSSSAPGVPERLLAVGGLGEQHPHAGLSTQRAQHRQRRRLLVKPPAVRGQALAGQDAGPVAPVASLARNT